MSSHSNIGAMVAMLALSSAGGIRRDPAGPISAPPEPTVTEADLQRLRLAALKRSRQSKQQRRGMA